MKIKQYSDLLKERIGFDHIDEPYDESDENTSDNKSFGDPLYFGEDEESMYVNEEEEENGGEEEESQRDEEDDIDMSEDDIDILENLASLIRQLIKAANIENYYVFTKNYNISIQFVLNKRERFRTIMKVLGLLKKLNTDTLIEYTSELDLWETKDGSPLLTVDFYYDSKKSGNYKKDDIAF
jgi:hypothetical protein